jgi:hypothetical protein
MIKLLFTGSKTKYGFKLLSSNKFIADKFMTKEFFLEIFKKKLGGEG